MKNRFLIKFSVFFIFSSLLLALLIFVLNASDFQGKDTSASEKKKVYKTVVIDAGHGGEDGGASSLSGLVEKDINLNIAKTLRDMLEANSVEVVMTRSDDRLLYDRNTDYHGRKKALDLAARLTVADNTPDSIFISIHMNSFTNPKYSGLQVWYSQNNPDSSTLAQLIQDKVKESLQNDNTRKIKGATSSIYLLERAKNPAVLVECGFLSNPQEAEKFAHEDYCKEVAFVIFCSIMEFLEQ